MHESESAVMNCDCFDERMSDALGPADSTLLSGSDPHKRTDDICCVALMMIHVTCDTVKFLGGDYNYMLAPIRMD